MAVKVLKAGFKSFRESRALGANVRRSTIKGLLCSRKERKCLGGNREEIPIAKPRQKTTVICHRGATGTKIAKVIFHRKCNDSRINCLNNVCVCKMPNSAIALLSFRR